MKPKKKEPPNKRNKWGKLNKLNGPIEPQKPSYAVRWFIWRKLGMNNVRPWKAALQVGCRFNEGRRMMDDWWLVKMMIMTYHTYHQDDGDDGDGDIHDGEVTMMML